MKRFTLTPRHNMGTAQKTYEVFVDDEDACLLRSYAWTTRQRESLVYIVRHNRGEMIYLHKMIQPGKRVYFANGNTFDCRRANLTLREPVDLALFRGFMRRVNHVSNFSPALAS